MKLIIKVAIVCVIGFNLCACGGMSFNEQIVDDISTKMGTGICDSIPKGSKISNIQVGEIVDIGMDGMTDVTIEFDYEAYGEVKHKTGAMLYLKRGSSYKLAVIGGCEYGDY